MSLAVELQNATAEVERIDVAISELVCGVTVQNIVNDPAFTSKDTNTTSTTEKVPQNLSIYQLNAKLKELEEADAQLKDFWVIKNLFKEVELALQTASSDGMNCDKDELWSIVQNFQKISAKIRQISAMKLAISLSMKEKYESMAVEFSALLSKIFHTFFPPVSPPIFTANGTVTLGESSLEFGDFVEVANAFESLHNSCKIPEMLNSLKIEWDQKVLEPLISKQISLRLSTRQNGSSVLETMAASVSEELFMSDFLYSLQCFVRFVNVTNLRSLKNYLAFKISNGLVDLISANITYFTGDESLIQLLLQTLELFSSSGWTLPLRNVFVANSDVRDTLRGLHLNWITEKYIDQLRSIFTGPSFEEALSDQHSVSDTVEIEIVPAIQEPISKKSDVPKVPEVPVAEDESEDLEWDDWGSDDDNVETATKASNHSDNWDDNWDENWSDDDGEESVNTSKNVSSNVKVEAKPSAEAVGQNENVQVSSVPQKRYETYYWTLSSIPQKLTNLLENWKAETGGADDHILLDTIFSLALTAYPLFPQSFLLLNDLRGVGCQSSYLRECADTEWRHFCQSFAAETAGYLQKPDSLEHDENSHLHGKSGYESIDQIKTALSKLFDGELYKTNAHELKSLILHILDLINNVVLQKILRCEEITEYQSEEFTRYLETLQALDSETLARVGADINVLTTTNKVMQTKFLINNHLKSIMEYFYHGELYDFQTEELVSVIKSVFIPSELRENCIREIIDVRSS